MNAIQTKKDVSQQVNHVPLAECSKIKKKRKKAQLDWELHESTERVKIKKQHYSDAGPSLVFNMNTHDELTRLH